MSTSPSAVIVGDPLSKPVVQHPAAEVSIVAACLVDAEAVYDVGADLLPEHFAIEQPRLLWSAIHALASAGSPIDTTTVIAWLRDRGLLEKAGGVDGIEKIRSMARDVQHVGHHASLVQRLARLRATLAEAGQIIAEGSAGPGDLSAWLDNVGARIEGAAHGTGDTRRGSTVGQVFDKINAKWAHPAKQVSLTTGHKRLDTKLGGMRPGALIVIGAYSKHGKTAFAAGIADHVACEVGIDGLRAGVAVFTVEMTEEEYLERMWCSRAGVNNKLVLSPVNWEKIDTDQADKLAKAQTRLRAAPLKIFDDPGVTPSIIRAELRRLAAQWARDGEARLRLAVVDYAQILSPDRASERRRDNREQEVASISRTLKNIAAELKITIILLAQLNDNGKRDGRPPSKDDLRESRALLFDANAVVLVHNPSVDEEPEAIEDEEERFDVSRVALAWVTIAALRGGGETGKFPVTYRPGCTRFEFFRGPIPTYDPTGHATQPQPSGKRGGRYARRAGAPQPPPRGPDE